MHIDPALRQPFPASKKTYLSGVQYPDLHVPVREVALSNGQVVPIYDTSGPYTDSQVDIDITKGLPDIRTPWIVARKDTEVYAGRTFKPQDNGYVDADKAACSHAVALQRQPRRAKNGCAVTQLHYAKA